MQPPVTPSPQGVLRLKKDGREIRPMNRSNRRAETELAGTGSDIPDGKLDTVRTLEHEIECPRCHDSMTLYSEFDSLYYSCETCDFCLFTLKKT